MARIFKTPFGAQGDTEQVPEAPQGDGSVSLTQGFGYDYEREYEDPAAKDIRREVMNGLFHDITEAIGDIQLTGVAKWSADAAPYPAGAVLWHDSVVWMSTAGNNSSEPGVGTNWEKLLTAAQLASNDPGQGSDLIAHTGTSDTVTEALDKRTIYVENAIQVTVGSGGDHATISEALEYLSRYRPTVDGSASVLLLSGFVVAEQVLVTQTDLSWVTITSEDAEVTVQRSAITQRFGEEPNNESPDGSIPHFESYPVFGFKDNAKSPIFDVLFNMDTSGERFARGGFSFTNNCEGYIKPGKGMKNCGGCALYATQNSRVYAYRADFSNAGNGYIRGESPEAGTGGEKPNAVACFRGSWVNVRQADLSSAGLDGIYTGSSSVVEALDCDLSGAGKFGIHCYANGRVNARDSDITNCGQEAILAETLGQVVADGADMTGAGASGNFSGILARDGGVVSAKEATISGATAYGAYAEGGGKIYAGGATLSGNGSSGCRANRGSTLCASNATFSGNTGSDIECKRGSFIDAHDTGAATLSKPANTLDSDGVIFRA